MYYFMICFAALLFSVQFLLNDEYRKESGDTWSSALKFSLYTSIWGLIALLCINKLHMEVTYFSVVVAFVYSVVTILLSYSSIQAFLYANLSVYSVFAMIGGMLLPFIYGVICGEELTWTRIVCFILITACVLMSVNKGKNSKKAIIYYIAVFVLNGMVGVISKFHQAHTDLCVDSGSFMILTKIISVMLAVLLITIRKKKDFSISRRANVCTVIYSLVNSVGNLLLLIALIHLPASVQYPIVTGGTIVFAGIISVLRKEKLTVKEGIGAVIAFAATIFMAF